MEAVLSRPIVSRRSRPAKPPLSRDLIVASALQILDRDGLAGLSLRRVAAVLDTGAASLYVYLANLDELHALMLDQALSAVRLPNSRKSSWRHRLKAFLLSYLHVLYERRGLAQLALSTISSGPHTLRIWERLLGLLKEGGVEDAKAVWAVDLLTLYVTAVAAEKSNWRENGQGPGRVKDAIQSASAEEFPLVFASKKALLSGDAEVRLHWALDVLIDGIIGARLPKPKRTRSAPRRTPHVNARH
jgi:AcrR family transcriptional regulator